MQSSLRTFVSLKERLANAISPLLGATAAGVADVAMGLAAFFNIDVMLKPNHAKAIETIKEQMIAAKKSGSDDGEGDDGNSDGGEDGDATSEEFFRLDSERYGRWIPHRSKTKTYTPGPNKYIYHPLRAQQILDYQKSEYEKRKKQLQEMPLYIEMLELQKAIRETEVMTAEKEAERIRSRERHLKEMEEKSDKKRKNEGANSNINETALVKCKSSKHRSSEHNKRRSANGLVCLALIILMQECFLRRHIGRTWDLSALTKIRY